MSSNRTRLNEDLRRVHDISSNNLNDQSSVVEEYKNKVEQNLQMKEELISLQTKLKLTEEQISLQAAEFSFQKNELMARIMSLQNIEADLRQAIVSATNEKNEAIRLSDNKLRSAIAAHEASQKEAFDTFHDEIRKLREENANLQVSQEVLTAENRRLTLHNDDLNDHFSNQEKIVNKRIEAVRGHLDGDSNIIAKLRDQIMELTTKYETEKTDLSNQLIAEQQKSTLLDSQLKIANDKEKSLEKQIEELRKANEKLSQVIYSNTSENGSQRTLIDQLKNEKVMLEMEVNNEKARAIEAENRLNECDSVATCSELMKTRVIFMKTFCKEWNQIKHEIAGYTNFSLRDIIISITFAKRWLNQHTAMKENKGVTFTPKGGLRLFVSSNPRTLVHEEFRRLVATNNELEHRNKDLQRKVSLLEEKIYSVQEKKDRKKAEREAMSLKLKSALKCNNILHKHISTVIPE